MNSVPVDPAIVATILSIPRSFREQNKSPVELVAESGYRTVRESMTPLDLRSQLEANPDLVSDWEIWSQDKRSSDGWYFLPSGDGGRVGQVGPSATETYFPSLAEACAHFIILELAAIDSSGSSHAPPNTR